MNRFPNLIVDIPVEEAVDAVTETGYVDEGGRRLLRCFRNGNAEDWQGEEVVRHLRQEAERITWSRHPTWGWCLITETSGQAYVFTEVKPLPLTEKEASSDFY